ncbi:MAG TPA: hypothetical protein VMV18_13760 [bacterium]|nr:hypothetical protein [bacterium]
MAVFTRTYVQCDLCEQQRELPMNGEGWYKVETTIRRLNAVAAPNEPLATRVSDVCQSCFAAIQEGEFSHLFFTERPPRAQIAPAGS